MELRDLKAVERRKIVRKYIRQNLTEVEMAKRLSVNVSTICEDVSIIRDENSQRILANKNLIDKDIDALLKALYNISEVDEESWKIYYEAKDDQTKLQALEKIRQNNLDRAKLLKLLNPSQVSIEKLVYIQNLIPIMVEKIVNIAINYITDKDKQIEFLGRVKDTDIEGEN